MMSALIRRDIRLISRSPAMWLSALVFFALFLALCAIALGGDNRVLRPLAPALVWLAVLFSLLLSFNSLFQSDFEDRSMEQLVLSGTGTARIVLSRGIAFFLCIFLPLLIAVPLAGSALALPAQAIAGLTLSLCFSAPALTAYGLMTAAMMAGRPQSGFLSILITAPLLIPVLIFGVAAVDSYALNGLSGAEFKALAGISLIGCAIGIPAAAAALSTNLE